MSDVFFVNVFPPNDRQEIDFDYSTVAAEVVRYSVDLGFKYTLMTVSDKRIDPWVLSQFCIQLNSKFSPMIAVNPFYQHPISVVKKIISLKKLFPAKIAINLVTGSFVSELKAVDDELDFSKRSERLVEFYEAMTALTGKEKGSFKGNNYHVESAELYPKFTFGMLDFFVSGAMSDKLKINNETHFVRSIKPLNEMIKASTDHSGLGIGICARSTREEAITEMQRLYPADRKGEMLFAISLANSETPWTRWMKNYLEKFSGEESDYCLRGMKNFWSSSPFVVGSYKETAQALKAYSKLGYQFFVLDFLPEEAPHIKKCLEIFKTL